MDKIAVGPKAVGMVNIDAPVVDNLKAVARAKGKDIEDVFSTDCIVQDTNKYCRIP